MCEHKFYPYSAHYFKCIKCGVKRKQITVGELLPDKLWPEELVRANVRRWCRKLAKDDKALNKLVSIYSKKKKRR